MNKYLQYILYKQFIQCSRQYGTQSNLPAVDSWVCSELFMR